MDKKSRLQPVRNPFSVIAALNDLMANPKCKDQRVAQVINNALRLHGWKSDDIYYVEDDILIAALRAYNTKE